MPPRPKHKFRNTLATITEVSEYIESESLYFLVSIYKFDPNATFPTREEMCFFLKNKASVKTHGKINIYINYGSQTQQVDKTATCIYQLLVPVIDNAHKTWLLVHASLKAHLNHHAFGFFIHKSWDVTLPMPNVCRVIIQQTHHSNNMVV